MTSTLDQEAAVRRVITAVAHEIDARRWPELRRLFADTVRTDYTSLFGGEPQTLGGNDLIDGWRGILSPLEATQHLLGPIDVRVHGEIAEGECHVRGYHRAPAAPGGPEWMVAGHYRFELAAAGGAWGITRMTLQLSYQTGNLRLLQEAAATAR
jgi:hypothetical protein